MNTLISIILRQDYFDMTLLLRLPYYCSNALTFRKYRTRVGFEVLFLKNTITDPKGGIHYYVVILPFRRVCFEKKERSQYCRIWRGFPGQTCIAL